MIPLTICSAVATTKLKRFILSRTSKDEPNREAGIENDVEHTNRFPA